MKHVISRVLGVKKQEDSVEAELTIAPLLCDPNKLSLDIGADCGGYARRLCSYSRTCIAFEPRSERAGMIRSAATANGLPISVESVALSDREGSAELRVLKRDPGRSTIDPFNVLADPDKSPVSSVTVPTKCLDSYGFADIGFIKIDVEGHELAVLRGAEKTIRNSMPNLLVEVEERHHPGAIEGVRSFLEAMGYEGFYILNGEVYRFADFDTNTHQDSANIGSWKAGWKKYGTYVNNFFFLPVGSGEILQSAVRKSASSLES